MKEFGRLYLRSGELSMVLTVLVPGVASAEAGRSDPEELASYSVFACVSVSSASDLRDYHWLQC